MIWVEYLVRRGSYFSVGSIQNPCSHITITLTLPKLELFICVSAFSYLVLDWNHTFTTSHYLLLILFSNIYWSGCGLFMKDAVPKLNFHNPYRWALRLYKPFPRGKYIVLVKACPSSLICVLHLIMHMQRNGQKIPNRNNTPSRQPKSNGPKDICKNKLLWHLIQYVICPMMYQ